jgi:hypothetical protein
MKDKTMRAIKPEQIKRNMIVVLTTTACDIPSRGTVVETGPGAVITVRFDSEWGVRQLIPFSEITSLKWEI